MHGVSRVVRSHTDLWVWQLSHELKVAVDALLELGPIAHKRHARLRSQLRRSASNAPDAVAEGFGRQLPRDFVPYLTRADAELKRTFESLQDGCEIRCFTDEQVAPLCRLSTRASHAMSALVRYLKTAEAPPQRRLGPSREGRSTQSFARVALNP